MNMARTTVDAQLAKLKKQREAIEAKEKALMAKANDKVIAEIVALAKKHNVTIAELTAALGKGKSKAPRKAKAVRSATKTSDKRTKVAPKYRNPNDAGQNGSTQFEQPRLAVNVGILSGDVINSYPEGWDKE